MNENQNPILRKSWMVRRYRDGQFGNCSPTWNTLEEYSNSKYSGMVHIRNRIQSGPTWYNIPDNAVASTVNSLIASGTIASESQVYFSGMAPHHCGTIQGEVVSGSFFPNLQLTYNTIKKPMREGFAEEQIVVEGLKARMILKGHLCSNSFRWMEALLEDYPDHVVEFSSFSVNWGTLRNHNTAFWEVRKY